MRLVNKHTGVVLDVADERGKALVATGRYEAGTKRKTQGAQAKPARSRRTSSK